MLDDAVLDGELVDWVAPDPAALSPVEPALEELESSPEPDASVCTAPLRGSFSRQHFALRGFATGSARRGRRARGRLSGGGERDRRT